MPRNTSSTQTSATGAATARAAKPRTPRVASPKHSKAVSAEAATVMQKEKPHEAIEEIVASLTEVPGHSVIAEENSFDAISKIAYRYWEERGHASGDPLEDWVRAEAEYRRR